MATIVAAAIGMVAAAAGLLAVDPILAVVLILGLGAALLALDDPDWALAGLCLVTYLNLSEIAVARHGAPSIAKALVGAGVALALLRWLLVKERPGWSWAAVLVLGLFGVVRALSVLVAEFPEIATQAVGDYLRDIFICIVVILLLTRPRGLYFVLWALIAGAGVTAGLTVLQAVLGLQHNDFLGLAKGASHHIAGEVDSWRYHGPLDDPNYYAQMLLLGLPLAFDRMVRSSSIWARLVSAVVVVAIMAAVLLTASRGGMLSMVALLLVLTVVYRMIARAAIIGTLAVAIALPTLPPAYVERVTTVVDAVRQLSSDAGDVDRAVSGRLDEKTVAIQMFLDHPILGVGVNHYPEMFQHYTARLGLRDRFEKREAHNLYLEIAAETGILGILALGAIGIAVLRAHSVARRRFLAAGRSDLATISTAFLLGLLGHLLAGMFLHEAWARSWWMVVAIVLALPAVARHVPLQNRQRLDAVRPAPPLVPAANPSASPQGPQWTDRRSPVSA